jgi:hypothetical protein
MVGGSARVSPSPYRAAPTRAALEWPLSIGSDALRFLAAMLALGALASCAPLAPPDPFPPEKRTPSGARGLEFFASLMVGTFESIEQRPGAGDSSRVRLRQARLWPERKGEVWIYAEYERVGVEGRPYRQRIYRLGEAGDQFLAITYRIPGNAASRAGAWRDARPLHDVDPARLEERVGCRILWSMLYVTFRGGTQGTACPADDPAAKYERSEFSLSSTALRTWDRGFDANGTQVSGSTEGPLEMRRVSEVPR